METEIEAGEGEEESKENCESRDPSLSEVVDEKGGNENAALCSSTRKAMRL